MSTPDIHAEVIPLRPPAPMASVQGSLALDLTPRTAPPRPRLRSAHTNDLVAVELAARGRVDAFVGRYLQAVVEIVTVIRDLVGKIRDLRFQTRVRSDERLVFAGLIVGRVVLLQSFADLPREVKSGEFRILLLDLFHDAEAVLVVLKTAVALH